MKTIPILLLTLACQLQADTIYDYQFFESGRYAPELGSPESARLSFYEPCGQDEGLSAIYSFEFTSIARGTRSWFGFDRLPALPQRTFTLADMTFSGLLSWDEKSIQYTTWGLLWKDQVFDGDGDAGWRAIDIGSSKIYDMAPSDYYVYSQVQSHGTWLFTGTRQVPETGSSLLYMGIAAVALFNFKRKLA